MPVISYEDEDNSHLYLPGINSHRRIQLEDRLVIEPMSTNLNPMIWLIAL